MRRLSVLMALCVMLGSTRAQAELPEQTLEAMVSRYATAISDFDQTGLEKLFAADYIEVSPVGEVDERSKTISFYDAKAKTAAAGRAPRISYSEPITRVYDDMAVTIAKLSFDLTTPDGSKASRAMRAVFVSRKVSNGWQFVSIQFTGIRAAPAAK